MGTAVNKARNLKREKQCPTAADALREIGAYLSARAIEQPLPRDLFVLFHDRLQPSSVLALRISADSYNDDNRRLRRHTNQLSTRARAQQSQYVPSHQIRLRDADMSARLAPSIARLGPAMEHPRWMQMIQAPPGNGIAPPNCLASTSQGRLAGARPTR